MKVRIPNDIRKYKTKDIGSFSFKEIGFIVVAVLIMVAGFKFFGSLEVGIFPAFIVLAFGFFKPTGMSLLQYLKTVGREVTSPRTYRYESEFSFDNEDCDIHKLYGDEYGLPTAEALTQRDKVVVLNKKDKKQII
jgi:hypothetical protein